MLAQHERLARPLHAVSQLDSSAQSAQLSRPDTVKARLTPKRPRRQVENDEYAAFVRRILRAPAAAASATSRPWASCSAWPRRSTPP